MPCSGPLCRESGPLFSKEATDASLQVAPVFSAPPRSHVGVSAIQCGAPPFRVRAGSPGRGSAQANLRRDSPRLGHRRRPSPTRRGPLCRARSRSRTVAASRFDKGGRASCTATNLDRFRRHRSLRSARRGALAAGSRLVAGPPSSGAGQSSPAARRSAQGGPR